MRVTIQNAFNDDIFSIEIDDDGKVEDIKVLIAVEKNIQVEEQVLLFNGRPL
jgi:hypothetical protein